MFKNLRSKKGFTLLELIVVVVVLGILAALAIPSFSTVKQSAADKVAYNSAESIVRNAEAQAAFAGAALSDTYVDAAGAETTGYNSGTNTVTITSGGKTGAASINATTGEVTIVGASSNGGGSAGGATYTAGTDFISGYSIYAGGAGSAASYVDSFSQVTTTTALYSALAAATSVTMVLTDGANSTSWTASASVNPANNEISLSPNFSTIVWSEFAAFPSFKVYPTSINWNPATSTLTFTVPQAV